ncbi:MAG TPA: gliding motility-associated ABC transporter ATP-binding subunit GldA [Bacteroidales bacterium]|nr:gliding motility-associated ABC transporter ATP-binding subunit GldA [Bacteroidales bacterium]HNS47312.1 gliding motility-associated ABC transporter ATP-binding subunit GldA [Bacteroidales bacterium]
MSVEIIHVTKNYGEQHALDDITFSLQRGEIAGLLGPNGAGKSTLMKIIACFIPPTHGQVLVDGFDVMSESIQVRRRIGYLPENNPLYTDMYVREYLSFIAGIFRLGKNSQRRVAEIIDMTGLGEEQHKTIGSLSKGYRQRVGLAQVLIHDPDVLIMDEPTSGLDPNQLEGIRNLIREIGREKTVMLSTHIMQEVEAVCTRAIIIDHGKIIADDHPAKLSKFSPDFDVILVEFSGPVKADDLKKLPGALEVKHLGGNAYHIRSATSGDIRPGIFRFAVQSGLTVLSLSKQEQSLEKVFQKLTKKEIRSSME